MNYNLIINIFDVHNEASILLVEKFNAKNILFFFIRDDQIQALEQLKEYYEKKFSNIVFDYKKLDINKPEEIENTITKYEGKEGIFNLTAGGKLEVLMIYTFCMKHKIECVYVDVKKERVIEFRDFAVSIKDNDFVDLEIIDVINSIGASIIVDSTKSYNQENIKILTKWINDNFEEWEVFKNTLQDIEVFIRDDNNPELLKVDKEKLSDNKNIVVERLKELDSMGEISIKEDEKFYEIHFKNDFIKTFLFKSGTWLEVLTQNVVEEIDVIDDVRSGLLFLWDTKNHIKNEIDVVAIKDSVMICISCKDSKRYDEGALNELNVYASRLGGDNVIKILVATREPSKHTVCERAKEMNINLVIFDGDIVKFKDKLVKIIKEEN